MYDFYICFLLALVYLLRNENELYKKVSDLKMMCCLSWMCIRMSPEKQNKIVIKIITKPWIALSFLFTFLLFLLILYLSYFFK